MGLCHHLKDYGRCAPTDHRKSLMGIVRAKAKAVPTSEDCVRVLIFDTLVFTPFHFREIETTHIGFNVGL